jgi:hypothetical protein
MLGLEPDTYNTVIWVMSQFGGSVALNWWLNTKTRGHVPQTFTELFEALKKTTFLPSIRDNVMNSMMAINHVNMTF